MKTDGNSAWEKTGELPWTSAYGVTLQHGDKWYIIGGMNSTGATSTAYCIDLESNGITNLPALPCTIDNAAGAISGTTIYVTGGNADGQASNRTFALEIGGKEWKELPSMPSPARVQPVCAATDKHLYVWGGFTPGTAEMAAVHTDGVRYSFSSGNWEKLGNITADGDTITLSGGFAIAACGNSIIAAGGVDKDIFLDAISGRYDLVRKEDYMYKPASWYRFNNELLRFDATSGAWSTIATDSTFARAGAQIVNGGNALYQIGGELKPGIRTPGIYRIKSN
jgi:cyclically-permuted mutarotase family protein